MALTKRIYIYKSFYKSSPKAEIKLSTVLLISKISRTVIIDCIYFRNVICGNDALNDVEIEP